MTKRELSPPVGRRILAAELKRLRGDAELTREAAEEAVGLSRNALYRYEHCQSSMQVPVAKVVFEHYGVSGDYLETLLRVVRSSRTSRKQGLVQEHVPKPDTPSWFKDFVVLERDASQVNVFSMNFIPGHLQTEDYARAVLTIGSSSSDVEDRVRQRMERSALSDRAPDPAYWVIIDEAVLRRPMATNAVMRRQLEHLVEMAENPHITIQVLREAASSYVCLYTSFYLLKFEVAPQYGIVYMEYATGAIYRDDPSEVAVYEDGYRHLTSAAVSEPQSIRVIKQIAKELYS